MKEAAALEALAQALASKVRQQARPPDGKCLRQCLTTGPSDAIALAYIRRIRLLREAFQLNWLVDQHLILRQRLSDLSPTELRTLLCEMEEAREAIMEGFPLEQTGLIKNMAEVLPRP
ncbi:hypothetical protein J5H37_02245 [Stenotrophomonas maltophilia]|uniref:hypothetical protein n=1 Tax=Stenotrophomonas maltophilia TaxID=40324 RepID=UPI0019D477FA|nr:hypothetical protein [Stenotrophomonas maltophilia]MBN7828343.1 hypothetical protein [Stenotrophomonas maltophilia]MBN7832334.1 hypothetical protein [Stenotrophomonas maltophilia]MBN7856629.1 hypothetical protein [Stenotrophomonas maltophilia]MBN7915842.1 hypothetical protein [Stenotrophomonas maltophilia]MBO2843793.1 hypothetical protein [Stenotrophomonas maltophilia]